MHYFLYHHPIYTDLRMIVAAAVVVVIVVFVVVVLVISNSFNTFNGKVESDFADSNL